MPPRRQGVGDPASSAGFRGTGVRDFGPGVPRDEHNRIFERFYRSQRTRARNVRGSGIGLSLVRHIVEAHGGRVVVTSPVESGGKAPGLAVRGILARARCCRRQVRRCAGRSSH